MKTFIPLHFRQAAVTCLMIALAPACGFTQVVLNELMANNKTAVANGSRFPDYIELYNISPVPADISGWSLSDDPLLPKAFVFPPGTFIPGNGYLRVWADSEFADPGMHTGFGLGATGDHVRLYMADGVTVVDEVAFGLQIADHPIGRVPDGTGAWKLIEASPLAANTAVSLGDRSQLWINEWMANPVSGDDWLEVFNSDTLPVELSGLVITDQPSGVPGNRAIPQLSFIAARGFVQFFASDLRRPDADHLDFRLSSSSETLTIYDADRVTILDRITYGAQQEGVSQGRAPDGGDTIVSFPAGNATPGASNFKEITNVVISEVLAHTDPPLEDAIELANMTDAPVDISHWWLSDSGSQPRKYRIPNGTVIPANGFIVFYQYQFDSGPNGFGLSSVEGDQVFLSAGNEAGELTGEQTVVRFGATKNGVSLGRVVTSTGVDFVPLSARTFGVDDPQSVVQFRQGTGAPNAPPLVGPIVISEIMFQPPVGGEEFIELHNPTAFDAPLFDQLHTTNRWRFTDGITFEFPPIWVPAGGFVLLVSFDPVADPGRAAAFRSAHGIPDQVAIVGPYSGSLNDSGEAIELMAPDEPEGPTSNNPGFVPYVLVERIRYSSGSPWPTGAAGTGWSLQKTQPLAYGNEPLNWAAAPATPGRAFTNDSDGDGMPDDWELLYELDPNSSADADEDPDNDGMSNLNEYRAGTNPRLASSVLAFTRVERVGDVVRARFHAVQGRSYTVEIREHLSSGSWGTLTNLPAASVTGEQEFEFQAPSGTGAFLRLSTVAIANP